MKRNILICVCIIAITFMIGLNSVLAADCSKCSTQNCSTCDGCTVYTDSGGYHYCMPVSDAEKLDDLCGCSAYTVQNSCEHNSYYSCLWVENEFGSYCNTDNLLYVACGGAFDIPYQVPRLISFLVNFLKILTPIILIFISVITLVKALAASKEDEIKKAQSSLIKKIIAAVMVFFVISIVQFVIMKVADSSETKGLDKCLTCFLNNDCGKSAYYKTNVAGTYECTYVDGSGSFKCKGNK